MAAHDGAATKQTRDKAPRKRAAHDARAAGRAADPAPADLVIYTVGHSTRSAEDFLALLNAHAVRCLVDVRTVPRSRHNPQFNRETLPATLREAGIGYVHMAALGGLRKPRPDSPNGGWRNLSFRGYADYMQTEEFEHGLDALLARGSQEQVAIMCAEAVPWRCHRSLIADALAARGVRAEELVDARRREPHRLTPFAVVDGTRVRYPPENAAPAVQPDLFAAPAETSGKARNTRKRSTRGTQ